MSVAAKLRTIVKAAKARGNHATLPDRIARRAYELGREDGHREGCDSTDKNDATVLRAALLGLGHMHHEAPPCVLRSPMYDLSEVWPRLPPEHKGEAILVCLAQQSEVDDPGTPPAWLEEYDRKDGVF